MELQKKVLPVVLSGTLAFGTMGMPLTAFAGSDDADKTKSSSTSNQVEEKAVEETNNETVNDIVEEIQDEIVDEKIENAQHVAETPVQEEESSDTTGKEETVEEETVEKKTLEGSASAAAVVKSTAASGVVETPGEDQQPGETKGDTTKTDNADGNESDKSKDGDESKKEVDASAVVDALCALPSLDEVTSKNKTAVNNLKNSYNALIKDLDDEERAAVDDEIVDGLAAKGRVLAKGTVQKTIDAYVEAVEKAEAAEKEAAEKAEEAEEAERAEKEARDAAKAEADQKAADAAIAAINALPAVDKLTSKDEQTVYDAKAVYDKLTKEQKELVPEETVKTMRAAVKAVDDAVIAEKKAAKEKAEKEAADKAAKEKAEAEKKKQEESSSSDRDSTEVSRTDASESTYNSNYAGQGYTRIKYSTNLSTEMFIASIGEQARQIGQENNLYASVMIAQAIIESDSGNSGLSQPPNYNLFGIKGSYQGQSVNMATQEDDGSGSLYGINSDFRKYDSQKESLSDYADLLRGNMSTYYNAWKENAPTYQDAAKALQGTYATSTIYADSICAVIEAYDLTRFDQPLDYTIEGTIYDPDSEKANKEGYRPLTMDDYVALQGNAIAKLGIPYVWGGTTEEGFDCSGFVQYIYKETFGIELPRTTYTQQYEGEEVPFSDLRMGDLLFFSQGGSTEHVAMYLGEGFYIHAPETGDVIKVADMESFTPTFAKRILKTVPVSGSKAEDTKAESKDTQSESTDESKETETTATTTQV